MGVDFPREFNKAGVFLKLTRFPSQIKRINRDAMTAKARAWGEFHEPEGFGIGRIEHLVYIDAHFGIDHLKLVHQGNIHRAEHILGNLDRFGCFGIAHRHGLHNSRIV